MADRGYWIGGSYDAGQKIKPTDVILKRAFIASYEDPVFQMGVDVTGEVSDCHFVRVGGYTPSLFRRPRLRALAPLARRVNAAYTFWRWL